MPRTIDDASCERGPVLYSVENGVALIELNRPERLNAWTPELGRSFFDLIERADASADVRVIVISGRGRGFCAGADMDVLNAIDADIPPEQDPRPLSYVQTIGKPVIAAINGACAGIGLVAALMCDMRFAAEHAKFTTAFARRGLIAEYGSAWVLTRALGPARALDVLLSARTFLAPEAKQLGLVERVLPADELMPATTAYARELAQCCSPWSMSVIKRQVYEGLEGSLASSQQLADAAMHESFARPDLAEGVASFKEKRLPEFPPLTHPGRRSPA